MIFNNVVSQTIILCLIVSCYFYKGNHSFYFNQDIFLAFVMGNTIIHFIITHILNSVTFQIMNDFTKEIKIVCIKYMQYYRFFIIFDMELYLLKIVKQIREYKAKRVFASHSIIVMTMKNWCDLININRLCLASLI